MSGRRAERERERQNLKQAPGSELSAQSPMWGSNSQTARSWPGWMLNRLSHPGAPICFLKILFFSSLYTQCGGLKLQPWDHESHAPLMSQPGAPFYIFIFSSLFILRETETVWVGEGQRERGRDRIWSRLQALSRQHRARCGTQTHELWDHDLSRSWMLNQLSHPGTPRVES